MRDLGDGLEWCDDCNVGWTDEDHLDDDADVTESSDVLRYAEPVNGTTGERIAARCWVWCPGCDEMHQFIVAADDGFTQPEPSPTWGWDRNVTEPTFTPSMLVEGGSIGRCHSFLERGVWRFLDDSSHALRGEHPMVPLPGWLLD